MLTALVNWLNSIIRLHVSAALVFKRSVFLKMQRLSVQTVFNSDNFRMDEQYEPKMMVTSFFRKCTVNTVRTHADG